MGKELFDLKLPGWRNYGVPDDILAYLRGEARFDSDSLVKINPVRAVFACGDCFVKFEVPDRRLKRWRSILRPKAKSEFRSGRQLADAGIPVVEYLGWLRKGPVNVTVSRRWPGGVDSAYDYLYREGVYGDASPETIRDFAAELRDFLAVFQRFNFRHPDLHLGNILYAANPPETALVDVYGVCRKRWLTAAEKRRQGHLLTELRPVLTVGEIAALLAALPVFASQEDAAEFFWRQRTADAAAQLRQWPKRQLQIMRAYPKLIKLEDDTLLRRDELRRIVHDPETCRETLNLPEADAFALLQASLHWQLCGIPHRRVSAWRMPGTIFLEPVDAFRPAGEEAPGDGDFRRELEIFGFADPGPLARNRRGRLALFDPQHAMKHHRDLAIYY